MEEYESWDHRRISIILSEEISLTVAAALARVFIDEGAEKDWNIVWKELILYRDLVIVLFYSKAKLENEKNGNLDLSTNLSANVKLWSSDFIDILMKKTQKVLIDNQIQISVFRKVDQN